MFFIHAGFSQRISRTESKQDRIENGLESNPILYWGTFYSGSGWLDWNDGKDIAIDHDLNVYIVGRTESTDNISTPSSFQPIYGGGDSDGYLLKFDKDGYRIWATYYGGSLGDEINSLKIDHEGNIIVVGGTLSGNNISTQGSYQEIKKSKTDGFIAKFDFTGNRLWGSYLGGYDEDYLYRIAIDENDNIIVAGNTRSTSGLVTPGCFQPNYGGSFYGDGFLAKFTKNGQMIFCTYYGGEGSEELGGANTDTNGNIYIFGDTDSYQNIATPGTQQPNYTGIYMDGFIAKFDSNGQRIWGTYVGGSLGDFVNQICCDTMGNVYACGATLSSDNIATPNQYKVTSEQDEGFVIKFNKNGIRLWGSYYGGENSDGFSDIVLVGDKLLLSGGTNSLNSISTPGAHQLNWYPGYLWNGVGHTDGFITCFDTTFHKLWGTYLGSSSSESISNIDVDRYNNIVYVGTTSALMSEYLTTPNCFQIQGNAMYNTFFGKLVPDSVSLAATNCYLQQEIEIYPNPAKDVIRIFIQCNRGVTNQFTTFNTSGFSNCNYVFSCDFFNSYGARVFPDFIFSDNKKMTVNVSSLSSGLYTVILFLYDNPVAIGKFIIIKSL